MNHYSFLPWAEHVYIVLDTVRVGQISPRGKHCLCLHTQRVQNGQSKKRLVVLPSCAAERRLTSGPQVDLLVNILHGAVADLPNYLMGLVMERSLVPRWTDIPLPQGKTTCDGSHM